MPAVPADIATAVVGAADALIGGGVTSAVTYLNLRTQREQAQRARQDRVIDVRRDAWATFLTRADSFLDHARELTTALAESQSDERIEDVQRYADEWTQFAASHAAPELAGPAELAWAGKQFRRAVGAVGDACDSWHRDRRRPRGYDAQVETVQRTREEFVATAQRLFDPQPPTGRRPRPGCPG